MKISEMTNEQAAEAILRLSVPFGNICDDEEIVGIIKKFQDLAKKEQNIKVFGRMAPEIVTYAMKTHKDDLFEVVGALTMQTRAQVAKMNFVKTINVLKESYDEVLRDFFTSSKERIRKTAGESAPE